jgi:hypothetical protein
MVAGEIGGANVKVGETVMAYHLIQRVVSKGQQQPQYRKETFSTEPEAVIRACSHYAAGFKGDFVIEDEKGNIVTNDQDIRSRCKATRID